MNDCPHCDAGISVAEKYRALIWRTGSCPACGRTFRMPRKWVWIGNAVFLGAIIAGANLGIWVFFAGLAAYVGILALGAWRSPPLP